LHDKVEVLFGINPTTGICEKNHLGDTRISSQVTQ
jgi:hypothetical protein